mmetsp:Transcript_44964/g.106785  ORF Transcript_44964/g.106785 Transcript_44964/m.106785 type:complete len:277 (-) Transcript_44964:421-1251(-)
MSRLPPSFANFLRVPVWIVRASASLSFPARISSLRLHPSSPKRQLRSSPSAVKRSLLQPPQNALVMLEMTPKRPCHPGTLHSRATSCKDSGGARSSESPRDSTCRCIVSTISAWGTSLPALQLLPSKGINSRNLTSMGHLSARSMKLPISSSFMPRIMTQLTLTLKNSGCSAVVWSTSITRACQVCGRLVNKGNLGDTSVSKLMLMFRKPAARNSGKKRFNRMPLVVMPILSGSGSEWLRSPRSETMRPKSDRIVGSPPVKRTLRTPSCVKSPTTR